MAVLVTGGARSGKSSFAEAYAERSGDSGIYVATSRIWDEEMAERVANHRLDRERSGFPWRTVEEPLDLAGVLAGIKGELDRHLRSDEARPPVVLIDCLTLWLSNWMFKLEEDGLPDKRLNEEYRKLAEAVEGYPYPLLLVTNEVGGGVVPAYPLGRRFRDEAGRLNRLMAQLCDRVFLVTAGIPVELKSIAFKWENL
ncbi:bifunctional adenosylcobinamide kinase/adenosylcobinamide-phosphate guanylyltransferase [Paenibacillus thailandensis]|uniref:Adenosylcobinamide kinase n=1 Tax=Paenibacillus thailandensis TaxID=393250 RepID=A0ABW5R1S4_9BACL